MMRVIGHPCTVHEGFRRVIPSAVPTSLCTVHEGASGPQYGSGSFHESVPIGPGGGTPVESRTL
jgi:hypothetical protein